MDWLITRFVRCDCWAAISCSMIKSSKYLLGYIAPSLCNPLLYMKSVTLSTSSLLMLMICALVILCSRYMTSLGAYERQAVLNRRSTIDVSRPGCILIRHLLSIEMGSLCVYSRSCLAWANSFLMLAFSFSPDSSMDDSIVGWLAPIETPIFCVYISGIAESWFSILVLTGEGDLGDLKSLASFNFCEVFCTSILSTF